MQENIKGLYAAFKAKDARFDGRFFVGISCLRGSTAARFAKPDSPKRRTVLFSERPQLRNRPATGPAFCAGRNLLPGPLLLMLRLI